MTGRAGCGEKLGACGNRFGIPDGGISRFAEIPSMLCIQWDSQEKHSQEKHSQKTHIEIIITLYEF
jgi:hypothetical protein